MSMTTMLHDEIQGEFGELKKLEVGSDEYKTAVDGLTKLVDRAIEIDKFNSELREKIQSRESEEEFRRVQMKEDKKDRLVRNVLTGFGIAVPAFITVWGTIKTLKFELEGTVTTLVGKGFINRFFSKK